jgi:hypothetical protein
MTLKDLDFANPFMGAQPSSSAIRQLPELRVRNGDAHFRRSLLYWT